MRRHILAGLLLLLALLLAAACALASPAVHDMSVEALRSRAGFDLPEGMVARTIYEKGHILLQIDDQATDWQAVMLDNFDMRFYVNAPASEEAGFDANHNSFFCGGVGADMATRLLVAEEALHYPVSHPDDTCDNGQDFGSLDAEKMVFVPMDDHKQYVTLICWVDASNDRFMTDPSARYYEQVVVSVTHTQPNTAITMPLRYATPAMLDPMVSAVTGAAGSIGPKGTLTLHMGADVQDLQQMPLILNAPEGATRAELHGDHEVSVPVENGRATFPDVIQCAPSGMVNACTCTVKWLREDGYEADPSDDLLLDYGRLTVYAVPNEHDVYPSYVSDWHPIPEDRLKIHNNGKNVGLTTVYNETYGTLHVTRDQSVTPTGQPGAISVSILPPDKSLKYYRILSGGGDSIQGRGKEQMVLSDILHQPLQTVKGNATHTVFTSTPLMRHKAGPMEAYTQIEEPTGYGGGVWVIYWYDSASASEPTRKEYLCQTIGEMFENELEIDVITQSELAAGGQLAQVTLVKPDTLESSWKDWRLVVRRDPNEGLFAQHYELFLINDTGAYSKLDLPNDMKLQLYIPYAFVPDHVSVDDLTLYHFTDSYAVSETLRGAATPHGIMFEISSLSPFVLSWAPSRTAPATGDGMPLALLYTLSALSAAGMILLPRRPRMRKGA